MALLRAGWSLLRTDPQAATMAAIAAQAGVSRQAAYLHFGNRAGLLLAIVRWIDEEERIAEQFATVEGDPWWMLEQYLRIWLNYLPRLHPVPGFLAHARADQPAQAAWDDRMQLMNQLYLRPLRSLHRAGELRPGLSTHRACQLLRSVASVFAWEQLVHDHGWSQSMAVDNLWLTVRRALAEPAPE